MIDLFALNWVAILIATVLAFVLGGIWYGPVFGKAWLTALGKTEDDIEPSASPFIISFFTANAANGFVIEGHTDSRGSDRSNMTLSEHRAQTVARVAQDVGARVYSVRGFGERRPVASNDTTDGMAQNRRVEILCLNRSAD